MKRRLKRSVKIIILILMLVSTSGVYFYFNKQSNNENILSPMVEEPNKDTIISIVGDVSLADNWKIAPKYDERNKGVSGILSDSVLDIMLKSDITVANSEFTVSNRGTPIPNKMFTFRAKPERLSIYHEMGVDLVTIANNHSFDYGEKAFFDMLDYLDEYNIPYIGAGRNLEEAMQPIIININGHKIGFLNATRAEKNILTPGATENSPGVFRCYDPTNMINQIKKVRENVDYLIVIIHFGKEGSHELEKEQVSSAKAYIDSGADVVVGHHAHMLQGVEYYNDKPIIYNLGDFIFNSKKEDTAIFQMKINGDNTLEYYLIPARQENEYTDLLDGSSKSKVISDLNSWSINATIDENGKILPKT